MYWSSIINLDEETVLVYGKYTAKLSGMMESMLVIDSHAWFIKLEVPDCFQTTLQSYSNQNSSVLTQKQTCRQMEQMETAEINP